MFVSLYISKITKKDYKASKAYLVVLPSYLYKIFIDFAYGSRETLAPAWEYVCAAFHEEHFGERGFSFC